MTTGSPAPRWSALPLLIDRVAPGWTLGLGGGLVVVGLLLVTRPLTSLFLLAIYVGVSAIVSGVVDLASPHRAASGWYRSIAIVWIIGGAAVLIWLGHTLELLPGAIAVLLVLGGLGSLGDARRGRASERVLSLVWGGAQIAFGALALSWPDVTVLVTAVVFGARTTIFGAALMLRSARSLAARMDADGGRAATRASPSRRAILGAAVGRYALAVILVAGAGASWGLHSWIADGAPVVDAFYDPPDDLPRLPGELVRTDEFTGSAPAGAEVRRFLYTTTDAVGRPAVGSALVIAPDDVPARFRPVVVWEHGTTGVARGCAPSLMDAAASRWAIPGVEEAIARGWVVVAPDLPGQGAPGTFPYLIGEGAARASLDAVRAARQVDGIHLNGRVAVWGHSQGGHAALWTSAIAESYAPELDVVGTAALAAVADPLALAAEFTRGAAGPELSVLISWVLVPYADTYPDIDLDDYIAPGSRAIVREMTQRCPSEPGVIVSVLAALGVSEDRPLYPADLTDGVLGRRLAENAATGPWERPILVAWGSDDEVIPPRFQSDLVHRLCEDGERVRWAVYDGYRHLNLLHPPSRFLPLLLNWTDALFTGDERMPLDDCARLGPA